MSGLVSTKVAKRELDNEEAVMADNNGSAIPIGVGVIKTCATISDGGPIVERVALMDGDRIVSNEVAVKHKDANHTDHKHLAGTVPKVVSEEV